VEVITGNGQFVSPHEIEVINGEARPFKVHHCGRFRTGEVARLSRMTHASSIPPAHWNSICPSVCWWCGGSSVRNGDCIRRSGVKVSVVELMDGLVQGCDRDLVKPLENASVSAMKNR
jgi:dihydrolipoamide dehydrogenase